MDDAQGFRRLLRGSLLALLLGAILVALCFFFVDKPVAFFVHDHHIAGFAVLKWLTYPPPILQAWAPVALAALMVRRAWGPFRRWEKALLAAAISMILADQFRESLSFVFGRTWPDTWIQNNPSLIKNNVYGFHPLEGNIRYGSFPSGHTARTLALAAVVWIAYPKPWWRGAAGAASLAVAVGLLGMNYHFVGDVIAGGVVGAVVGAYTANGCGLLPSPP